MEDQLIGIVLACLALVGILVKIVRDEVLLKRSRNGDNPSFASLDKRLDGLRKQLHEQTNNFALFAQGTNHHREKVLEILKDIRDSLARHD